ncbi:hypothetical protein RM549_09515 [Salegentibacter sp. F188]|uniref:DUF4440 domain-containing protein n=1 Tax=Autumnicola patrickiae TaxID=3075591 RepID=A0ABU3E225_9FLAO|nr:hypothetical protein [Salegentibacter sp. F188]MDT0690021.1 hypothetical protein [Salegentibacter sp. F188]
MKISKLLFLLFFVAIASCNDAQQNQQNIEEIEEQEVDVEDRATVEKQVGDPENLMKDWDELLNQEDTLGLAEIIADDAVLLTGGKGVKDTDSIRMWLNNNSVAMKGLTREAMVNSSGEKIRYQAGTFSKEEESTPGEGTYTIIWEQDDSDSQWKIKLLDISSEGNSD